MTSNQYRSIENRLYKKLNDRLIYEIDPENKFIYLKKFSIFTKNISYGFIITNSDNDILHESRNKIQSIILKDVKTIKRRFLGDRIFFEFLVKDIDNTFEISYIGESF
jgi:hypothetical protein